MENQRLTTAYSCPDVGTFARAVNVEAGRYLVDWQQFFFIVYFSHRRSAPIKKPKSTGAPKNLWVDPFPDPIGHFGVPWQPFFLDF